MWVNMNNSHFMEVYEENARLKAENEKLRGLCGEIQHFYAGIGTVLDAEHILKAWNNSSTKAEIDEALKGTSCDT